MRHLPSPWPVMHGCHRFTIRVVLMLTAMILSACAGSSQSAPPILRVAAAADLAVVMPDVIALHRRQDPIEITTILGSSGLLTRQIAQGAPFDVLFSANVNFVDDLVRQGHGRAETQALYARGRIVVWTRSDGIAPAESLLDLREARFRRIAIANPEHAPYGQAAQQALISAGIWDALHDRLVYGENIKQTLQIAQSGNAEVAIVALSLAIPTQGGDWVLLSDHLHEPIDQGVVVTTQSTQPAAAAAFVRTVNSPEGRAIMQRYGFILPGETLDPALLEAAGGRVAH